MFPCRAGAKHLLQLAQTRPHPGGQMLRPYYIVTIIHVNGSGKVRLATTQIITLPLQYLYKPFPGLQNGDRLKHSAEIEASNAHHVYIGTFLVHSV